MRAQQADAVLDCAGENDYLSWPEFRAHCRWHHGLPLLATEQVLRQKAQSDCPADWAALPQLQRLVYRGATTATEDAREA